MILLIFFYLGSYNHICKNSDSFVHPVYIYIVEPIIFLWLNLPVSGNLLAPQLVGTRPVKGSTPMPRKKTAS